MNNPATHAAKSAAKPAVNPVKQSSHHHSSATYVAYADGGSGNTLAHGKSGAGVIVQAANGTLIALSNRTLPAQTSTEAEYAALLLALEVLIDVVAACTANLPVALSVDLCMDSEVVVKQMLGQCAVNSSRLKPLHRTACELARQLPHLRYVHIPRDHNRLADALAGEAANGHIWQVRHHVDRPNR